MWFNSRGLSFAVGMLMLASAAIGCGDASRGEVYPVSGKVTIGGQPVEGAQINFMTPESSRVARGMTDASGEYTLTTYSTGDGAVAGDHSITIVKPSAAEDTSAMSSEDYMSAMQGNEGKENTDLLGGSGEDSSNGIPAKYGKPEESGLIRTVVAGETNVFDFDLSE